MLSLNLDIETFFFYSKMFLFNLFDAKITIHEIQGKSVSIRVSKGLGQVTRPKEMRHMAWFELDQ